LPEHGVHFILRNRYCPKSQEWNLGFYACCEVLIACPGPSRKGSACKHKFKEKRKNKGVSTEQMTGEL